MMQDMMKRVRTKDLVGDRMVIVAVLILRFGPLVVGEMLGKEAVAIAAVRGVKVAVVAVVAEKFNIIGYYSNNNA